MTEGSAVATIHIYGDVTNSTIVVGNNNAVGAGHHFDTTPLPAFDKDAPIADAGSLPAGSHLPFLRNELFTGREAELKTIAESLLGRQTSAVIKQAVTGMGGMGKTQLAVEFGYRYGRFFRGVHWLNMANPESINSEIANCGMQMGLPNFPDDLPSQVILTVNTWKAHGPRLLILDNFEEVGLVNQVMKHFNHSNLRVLLTSRHSDWSPAMGLNPIPLDVFSAEESLAFLKKSRGRRRDTDEELSLLAQRLGHLPLALELASRYLSGHPRLNVAGYLEQASHALDHPSMQNWRKDLLAPTEHDLSLVNTFGLSWQAVEGEEAQKVFMCAGYLAPNEPIPLEIFEGTLKISSDACDEAAQRLMGLGLLKREENDLPSIHPLLAEYARMLGKDGKSLESAAGAVATLSKKAIDTEIPADFVPLKAHVQPLAEFAEEAKLEKAGVLWNNYGYHLQMIADYSGAHAAYERALKIDKAMFGSDHPDVARDINNLGMVMKEQGDFSGAKSTFENALKIFKKQFGERHTNIAILLNNLGLVMQSLGDLNGARSAFEHAIEIDEANFGKEHPKVATIINNLGTTQRDMGDFEGAGISFMRALKIFEKQLGEDHPHVALVVNNLGSILVELGDFNGAQRFFERAIKIWESNLGTLHPQVAIGVGNLGSVLYKLGNLSEAQKAYEHALKIGETCFGIDHPNIAIRINNLGMVMQDLGDFNGARIALERAIKILEINHGTEHPQVTMGINNLGSVLEDMGDLNGACANYERALSILKKILPSDHPDIKLVQRNLDRLGLPSTNKNHE